ncbi:hypothetical protein HanXRQr2_Chr05g0223471 [Helianthus annuus]|uniref:Uncharacterized protein n=1 Tax=Helianthus annuus TaxID=4232 RepID=A0A9K3NN94_HELAN|nr:hypothetical protein HanXRQr2_Chr05g0223471 [Helianthus annuus]KAJ0923432.1 hypothetical protein HanPSC8_Chr05g0215811 [Helianthus annuus]
MLAISFFGRWITGESRELFFSFREAITARLAQRINRVVIDCITPVARRLVFPVVEASPE